MAFNLNNASRPTAYQLSPQQAAFIDWCKDGSGSAILEAVAGAGKTTTILEAVKVLPGNVAILAYNKKIADEIKERLQKQGIDWKHAVAGTVHSFGFNALRKAFGNPKVDEWKVADLVQEYASEFGAELPELFSYAPVIVKLVSMAKQRAIGITTPIANRSAWLDIVHHFDLLSELEDASSEINLDIIVNAGISVLLESSKRTDVIDFDDMVYLPVMLKCRFWQYDFIFVDEAQDTNPARRALVRAILRKGGRVAAVGDPCQAIYGFTGADNDSLDLIARDFNAVRMPLTVTYRCPQAVVSFSQQWVSHITAHETAPAGSVGACSWSDLLARRDELDGSAAMLCRNTKPLVQAAFRLIRERIACKVEGRDIGNQLVKLATKWTRVKTINALESKLEEYLDKQRTKYLAKKQEQLAQAVEDRVETLRVIMDKCKEEGKNSVSDVETYINSLFADDVKGIFTLSTIHKSKGREWQKVFWLDRKGTCPSKYARQAWQQEQERNLQYVAATRAMSELIDCAPLADSKAQPGAVTQVAA